jgi:hypothetical protein
MKGRIIFCCFGMKGVVAIYNWPFAMHASWNSCFGGFTGEEGEIGISLCAEL